MNTQRYKLSFIPLFEEDLNEITDYIANHLQNPDAAPRLFFLSISAFLMNPFMTGTTDTQRISSRYAQI